MKREIRSSTIVGTSGVGSVVDVGKESFVIPSITSWKQYQLRVIDLRRLSTRLHKVLKGPKDDKPSLMVRRFPRAMFCDKCRRITIWKTPLESENSEPVCPREGCSGTLVAMRFVAACENGHLNDVDWRFWAHSGGHGNRNCRALDKLRFDVDSTAATGGLSSLVVRCYECRSARSLEDISSKNIVKETFKTCSGVHPWQVDQREECGADVIVLQRGATNLHYPASVSALDIPLPSTENPATHFANQVHDHPRFKKLVELLQSTTGDNTELVEVYLETIGHAVGCDYDIVRAIADAAADGQPINTADAPEERGVDQTALLKEEWKTLADALSLGGLESSTFVAQSEELSPLSPPWLKKLISGVLLIPRLREVRAYLGFQRVKPALDKTVPPDVGGNEPWIPAVEVFGEGLLLTLNYDVVEAWATSIPVAQIAERSDLEKKRLEENFWFLAKVHPIHLALHTLSHLLLRRITFECGYSSSSLRERLYFDEEERYAAIMIYTADADSEGSLGGLVRQGRHDRFADSIIEAIDQGEWCSADPVCTETAGQGLGGFNHAACHACCLVSETSCTSANTLLDRRMLFDSEWGLLSAVGR
jgi:hypothetical protein